MKRAAKRARIKAVRAQQKINYDVNQLMKAVEESEQWKQLYQQSEREKAALKAQLEKLGQELKRVKTKHARATAKISNIVSTVRTRAGISGLGKDLFGSAPDGRAKANTPGPFTGQLGNKGFESACNAINANYPDFYQQYRAFVEKHSLEEFLNIFAEYYDYGTPLDYQFDMYAIREDGYRHVMAVMESYQGREVNNNDVFGEAGLGDTN